MTLAVGKTCVWYPHAESNQHPQAGIVTEVKQPGIYVMYVFPKGGGMPIQKTNVHHVDAEYLSENPNMRVLYGGWDTVEAADRRRADEAEAHRRRVQKTDPEPREGTREDQEAARVTVLSDRGFSVEEITTKLGDNWTEESGQVVIEKHKEAQTA